MFQVSLTSRSLGMHQRVIVEENSTPLKTLVPTRAGPSLRDIVEAREAVIVEGAKVFKKGDRVSVKGKSGSVAFVRMAGPSYSSPQAYSVVMDDKKSRAGYTGSMYAAKDVKALKESMEQQVEDAIDGKVDKAKLKQADHTLAGSVKGGSVPGGSIKPREFESKGKFSMAEMIDRSLEEKRIDWGAIDATLKDGLKDLQHLGSATGKHGSYYGIKGNSLKIRVGKRELSLDEWTPTWQHGKLTGTWGNKEYILLSKVTAEDIAKWVKLVKQSPTTKEMRSQERKDVSRRHSSDDDWDGGYGF